MFFKISSAIINKSNYNMWVLHGAKLTIDTYKITPSQAKLDNYLWKTYGLNIKSASLVVIANSRFQKNKSNELIVTFPNKRIDNLAALITYGNGKIQGCSILKEAFMRY